MEMVKKYRDRHDIFRYRVIVMCNISAIYLNNFFWLNLQLK